MSKPKEADMYPAVKAWLESRGYDVRAEFGARGAPVDVVGVRDGRIVAVEMKRSWSASLRVKFSYDIFSWADEAWFVCPGRVASKTMSLLDECGVGVWSAAKGVLLQPMELYQHVERFRQRAFDKFRRAPKDLTGGVPMQKGRGPRDLCLARIREYMRCHPKAKSRDVFEAVPNHYATFQSFSGVLGGFIRELRRAHSTATIGPISGDSTLVGAVPQE